MGNFLVINKKVIKIVKPDGKIIEYKSPLEVQQVLSDFSGYAISDSLKASHHLQPGMKLDPGSLYYLVPLPQRSPEVTREMIRFPVPHQEEKQGTNVLRMKLVISKQELKEMLSNGGFSVDDMISRLQCQQNLNKVDTPSNDDIHRRWKLLLESIPEVN